MKVSSGNAKIVLDGTILEIEAAAEHLSAAMGGAEVTTKLFGTFDYNGETVFCDYSPLIVEKWHPRGRVRGKVDGESLRLVPIEIRYATLEVKA